MAQICFQLEGIPLAVELAARVRALIVEQIAAHLNARLGLLTVGNRTAQSRQQTLQNHCLGQTRLILGEAAFAAAWEEGNTLPWEQAVAFAIADEPRG